MANTTPYNSMPETKNAAQRPNMKAVFRPSGLFLAVLANMCVWGGDQVLPDPTPVSAPIKKTTGGGVCRPVDLIEFNMQQSSFNFPLSPVPPFKKPLAAAGDRAKRDVNAPQWLKITGGQRQKEIRYKVYGIIFLNAYLTKQKNLLPLGKLSNFLTAVHRSDIADFLFVLFFEGQGQSIYFAFLFWGGVSASVRPEDSPVREFESTVPLLFQLSIKPNRPMKDLDLSPYLINIFTHSQQVSEWHNNPQELELHLEAIETWWTRHQTTGANVPTGVAYLMLAHLNMLKGYLYLLDSGEDWKTFNKRVYHIQAEIINAFGNAHAIFEHGEASTTCNQ